MEIKSSSITTPEHIDRGVRSYVLEHFDRGVFKFVWNTSIEVCPHLCPKHIDRGVYWCHPEHFDKGDSSYPEYRHEIFSISRVVWCTTPQFRLEILNPKFRCFRLLKWEIHIDKGVCYNCLRSIFQAIRYKQKHIDRGVCRLAGTAQEFGVISSNVTFRSEVGH